MNKLLENSKVQLTTAVVVCIFLIGVFTGEVAWKVTVARDLREIRLRQDFYGWDRNDMDRWILRTERLNGTWQGADLDKVTMHP